MNMKWIDGNYVATLDEVQKVFIQWKIISEGQFSWKVAKQKFIDGDLDSEEYSYSDQYKEAVRIKALRKAEEKRIGKKIWSKGAPSNSRVKLAEEKQQELTWVIKESAK